MTIIKEHATNTFEWRFVLLHFAVGYVLAFIGAAILILISHLLGIPLSGNFYGVLILYFSGAYLAYRYIKTYEAYPSPRLSWKIAAATSIVTLIFSGAIFLLIPITDAEAQQTLAEAGYLFWIIIAVIVFLVHLVFVKFSLSSVARFYVKRAEKLAKEQG